MADIGIEAGCALAGQGLVAQAALLARALDGSIVQGHGPAYVLAQAGALGLDQRVLVAEVGRRVLGPVVEDDLVAIKRDQQGAGAPGLGRQGGQDGQ